MTWLQGPQAIVNASTSMTGDNQRIHVDEERARRGPVDSPVTHGYYPISRSEVLALEDARARLNYGVDRSRFSAPVPVRAFVRLLGRLAGREARGSGQLYRIGAETEVTDTSQPALVRTLLYVARQRTRP